MTRNEEKIKELCSSASADINLCRVAYTVIDNAPEEEKATLLEAVHHRLQEHSHQPLFRSPMLYG